MSTIAPIGILLVSILSRRQKSPPSQTDRHRLRHLNRLRRAHRINNLVDDEERDAESAEDAQSPEWSLSAALPGDEQNKDGQMCQPLGILPGVNRAHAEGKNPARIPATVGFGPLPAIPAGIAGGTCPGAAGNESRSKPAEAPAGTPSIFAPRQSSQ
jgi:hypothetical protein